MHKVEFLAGTHIDNAAVTLCEAAAKHGEAVGTFNGIELYAASGYAPGGVVANFQEESERRAEAYRNSPEGRAAAAKAEQERASLQAKHDRLMAKLPSLDWSNDVAVLDWLCAMQEASDRIGVIVRRNAIVSTFEKHGFRAGENTGPDYRDGDRENMFRYLVGQALDGLENGPAIHPIIKQFADDWKARFAEGGSSR